jgi:hypothetical protein
MKKLITLIAINFCFSLSAQIGSWVEKNELNNLGAREDAGMVALDNNLYILGGYTGCGTKDFAKFNPATGEIINLKNLGTGCANPIYGGCLFTVQGKIYSFANNYGVNVYDTLLNTWTNLGGLTPNLSPDAGFVINDTIFLSSTVGNYFYSFNVVTNTFTQRSDLPGPSSRRGAIAFEINGTGYCGSGTSYYYNSCYGNILGCFLNDFYAYDPILNSWSIKSNLPYAFKFGIGGSANGKGYAGLGEYAATTYEIYKAQFWYEYDPIGNSWTQKQNLLNYSNAALNSGILSAATASLNGDIYVFGGTSSGYNNLHTDNIYSYKPVSNTWQIIDNEPGGNRTEAAGFYFNNKIYIGGGQDSEHLNDFYEYDILLDTWTPKSNFSSSHGMRSAVELGGKGYFIGGYQLGSNYIDSLLEYNPTSNQWSAKASFPGGQRAKMVALTYNGKLYAGMGQNTSGQENSTDFYSYDPSTNTWSGLASIPFLGGEDGYNLNYFVIADTAYVMTGVNANRLYKYSFLSNTWTMTSVNSTSINNTQSLGYTNQAFTRNGKGYVITGAYNLGDNLSEYDPTTGTWQQFLSMPFKGKGQSIITTPSETYVGFGIGGGSITELGILRSSDWHALKLNGSVSKKEGIYAAVVNNSSSAFCGIGTLETNASHSIYDENGDLFSAIIAVSTSLTNICYETNSIDTLIPYREMCGNFGYGIQESGMFLNKNSLIKNNNGVPDGGIFRMYFTNSELLNFIQTFNNQYNTNKTIDSIEFLQYFEYNNCDHNPLNNGINGTFKVYNPTFISYGTDWYVDLLPNGSLVAGELYATLHVNRNKTINTVECTSYTSPSGNYSWSTSGVYNDTIINNSGCDSLFTINLTINNQTSSIQTFVECNTYTWIDGNTYTSNNNSATHVLTNSVGCDSTITLNLTINNSNNGIDQQIACGSYTWIDGNTYTSNNNTAIHTLQNTSGCDSIVNLNLIVNQPTTGTDVQVSCNAYTWIDGITYTANNSVATYTVQNSLGCDSLITLDLTINNSNNIIDYQTACNSFTWINGNTYTTSNNTASVIYQNASGCDSVVSLDLTISYSQNVIDQQTACNSYTWIDGNTYTSSNSVATHVLNSSTGCDSTITLNLTINNSSSGTDTQTACDSFNWIDGNTYSSSNNSATYSATNSNGCDSLVTLNLTIINSPTRTDTKTACVEYTWIDGNTYTSSNNTAIFYIPNNGACDSIISLNLTLNEVNIDVQNSSPILIANSSNSSYQWIDCNNGNQSVLGEYNQSFTATINGSYAVIITDNNCSDTSICYAVSELGIDNKNTNDLIKVYPNPTYSLITIEVLSAGSNFEIQNALGQVVKKGTLINKKSIINIDDLSAGVYMLKIDELIFQQVRIVKME